MISKKIILNVGLLLLLSGCADKEMADLRSFVDDAFKDSKPDIEPLPVVTPFKGFAYSAADGDDPFGLENIMTETDSALALELGERPDENRVKGPLEEYPLDALRLVGTLSKKDKPWVIVKTSQGVVLLAQVGDYMGENNGQIKRISIDEQSVSLTETVPDPSGRWITRDVEIIVSE